jgi:hypothetical protein
MAGYTRQDTANNISNGNVIDADDFDAEYNALEASFNASTGHAHDGTAGEGAAITKVGPAQDLVVSGTALTPKTTNTLDLGTASVQYKNAWFDGTVDTDALTVAANATVGGTLMVTGGITGDITGDLTGDVTGDVTGQVSDISNHTSDELTEGTTNLFHTTARARSSISATGSLSYNSLTGVMGFTQGNTNTVPEGPTNLYYTTARATADAKAAISVTDSGGDGSLSYSAGVITYTGPSAAETRAHFSGGTGIVISNGEVAIDASGNPTLGSLVITGDLTVQGTTTSVSSQDVSTTNTFIILNSDEAGTPSADSGIEVERGTATNKKFFWDEANDRWSTGTDPIYATSFVGNASSATVLDTARNITLTGDVTGSVSFDGSANASITTAIADDSHNHIISNVDGLQTALDGKATTAQGSLADTAVQPNDNVTLGTVNTGALTASSLSGSISASNLTGSLPAINGSALTNMNGVNGAARGFIAFNGSTGGVISSQNVTLSKTATGSYNLTLASGVRGSSGDYCVTVGTTDVGTLSQTPAINTAANLYNAFVTARTASTITIKATKTYPQFIHFGGNDNNTAGAWGVQAVDPTYIAVVIY